MHLPLQREMGDLTSAMDAFFFLAAGSMLVRSRLPLLTVARTGKVGVNKMKRKNTEELTTSHKAHKCDTHITLKYGHVLV